MICHRRAAGPMPPCSITAASPCISSRRLEEALASYDSALAARPDYAGALVNRGVTLHDLKRFDEALASYDRAIAMRPDDADAHFFKGLSSLVMGDFERGWIECEWRRKAPAAKLTSAIFRSRSGSERDIAGKTILLHSEQGFGDTIQFCRYAAAGRGTRRTRRYRSRKAALELMTGLAGTAQVIAKGEPLPDFDFQCPLPSLPLAFKTRLETIPSILPICVRQNGRCKDGTFGSGPKRRPRIGLAWAGNPKHVRDRERSIGLRDLLPLLDVDATFVGLQKDVRAGDAEMLEKNRDILQLWPQLGIFPTRRR